jgi:hypothetical protein
VQRRRWGDGEMMEMKEMRKIEVISSPSPLLPCSPAQRYNRVE